MGTTFFIPWIQMEKSFGKCRLKNQIDMYQFLIVDDHCIFRQGVINIITNNIEQAFFGEANNSIEALVKVFDHSWDRGILDLDMPGRWG